MRMVSRAMAARPVNPLPAPSQQHGLGLIVERMRGQDMAGSSARAATASRR